MAREKQLTGLIGEIYDDALDPSHWSAVLQDLVQLTQSHTGNIAEINVVSGETRPLALVGIPPRVSRIMDSESRLL